ncbi:hypothetical protein LT493_21520 [Streptomyces tricolor]|nr:hypothetical protein [Streptomyces tricolor]
MHGHSKPIGRRGLLAPHGGARRHGGGRTGGFRGPVLTLRTRRVPRGRRTPLERAAHPLRSTDPGGSTADLRALGAMVGGANVVGSARPRTVRTSSSP